ncbi:putative RNA-directed DNA polymerase from transposon BS [Araneus ventricosus]|uniref:Putative RNA-directed DNA polymerase from transposon BS n=1 Tax=Araneus ventricosus TaxID=182803 RepID=A0A4Y2C0X1_ARAVE|nr:putative RNA-directed DNA polymerase from transposon BS [Araneus ventricosus]
MSPCLRDFARYGGSSEMRTSIIIISVPYVREGYLCGGKRCDWVPANAYADYFCSVFKPEYDSNDAVEFNSFGDFFGIDTVTYDDVVMAVKELKSTSTIGIDNIPPLIIKGCAEFLVYPLLALFSLSLRTNTFPHDWKLTKIVPVLKKGNAEECKNYRPIAILSPLSKSFEIIIHRKLNTQVKYVISSAQHGFMTKRSTSTNLLCLTDKVISAFEDNCQLDVIYTDFSKAFDLIDFGILMKKLRTIGFHVNLAQCLFSYLSNRTLYVYFNNVVSDSFSNTSVVPQGSILGPLVFILFINDLCGELCFSGCLLFADDLKFFRQKRFNADAALLQNNLDNLYQWCIVNKLLLNVEKCRILSFTRNSQLIFYSYQINGILLCRSRSVTDLGVTFDTRLDFTQYIDNIVSNAYTKLGFIKFNTSHFSGVLALKDLFFTIVRSGFEYCCLVWDPYNKIKIKIIEQVQKMFFALLILLSKSLLSLRLILVSFM